MEQLMLRVNVPDLTRHPLLLRITQQIQAVVMAVFGHFPARNFRRRLCNDT